MHILCGVTGDCYRRKTERYVNNRDDDKRNEKMLAQDLS